MKFQRNVWYVAAWPEEVGRAPLGRRIVGEPILLFRTEAGEAIAIGDVCPHRFALLSRGMLIGDTIECQYHGLRFDRTGQCVHNPHGDVIPRAASVKSYPIAERHGLIWIWPGDADKADISAIPDVPILAEGAGYHSAHNYLLADYRYDILVDNVLDLSHADFLHRGSFSSGIPARTKLDVVEDGDDVIMTRWMYEVPPPPEMFGAFDAQGKLVDQMFRAHWHPGQVLTFETGMGISGEAMHPGAAFRFAHIATPASESQTHYFFCMIRSHDLDNAELDAIWAGAQRGVIEAEDGPLLEDIHANMGGRDFSAMRPVLLPTDAAALRVRRVMDRLMAAE